MSASESPASQIGPYRLEQCLGRGGMGEVYRAYDTRLDRHVALKKIRVDKSQGAKARRRFLREARSMARLSHPSLVHVHDIFEDAQTLWIVMEWVEGASLRDLLKSGPLNVGQALALALDITSGLAAAHAADILHRDLKSENVVLSRGGRAKILDFGLAKELDGEQGESLTSGDLVGTPRAMSPEQTRGDDLDSRSDLFSLGILLYEMLSGQSPFPGPGIAETLVQVRQLRQESLRERVPEVTERLSALVDRLLEKDPRARPKDALEVLAVLKSLDDSPPDAVQYHPSPGDPEDEGPPENPESTVPKPFAERRQITILCCGLAGQDGSSGSLDPEILFETLPGFQALVSETIGMFGGYLAHVQGHRMVIYFGFPRVHEDEARRAVLAGLRIVERSSDLQKGERPVVIRLGIHSGPAIWSTYESAKGERERLLPGQTFDTAVRIQNQAIPGQVEISRATHHRVVGKFLTELIERQDSESPEVYRVVSEQWQKNRTAPSMTLAEERHGEFELLLERARSVLSGSGHAALIHGELGIGKSFFVHTLCRQLDGLGFRFATGHGAAYARNRPLFPFLKLSKSDLLAAPAKRLSENDFERGFRPNDRVGREFTELFQRVFASTTGPELFEPERDRAAIDMLGESILELAEDQPLVFIVEDLQWVDPVSLDLLEGLLREVSSVPLFLLLTCRPEFRVPWAGQADLTQLRFGPLASPSMERVLDERGAGALTREARRRVLERSDGVPLFACELLVQALEAEGDEESATIPARLVNSLTAPFDHLGTAKDLVRMAALLGQEFNRHHLQLAAPLDPRTLEQDLQRLIEARVLVVQDSGVCRFRRTLVYEAALESWLEDERVSVTSYLTAGQRP